jgi:hypothetical protein
MKKVLFFWLFVSGITFFCLSDTCADTIYLEDGSSIKGLVVESHCDRVVFSTADGEKVLFKSEIDEIFFDELEQNYYYIANRFACDMDFERAERFYSKALTVNPDYKEAKDALVRLDDKRMREAKRWKAGNPSGTLKKQLGISLKGEDDSCIVDKVFEEKSLFSIGDAITAIWDESARFMKKDEVAEKIIGPPGTSVKLTIQRNVSFCSRCVPWYFRILGIKKETILPLTMKLEGLTVGEITEESVARKSGLMHNDRILAIDARPTRYMPLSEANSLIHKEIPQEVQLTIEREVTLTRRGQ